MSDSDEEFNKKIDRAKKAMDVMKQLGSVFGSTKKIISEPIHIPVRSLDEGWINSIFFIENGMRIIQGDIGDIKTMLSKSQQIKDLIAFIEREKFVVDVGSDDILSTKNVIDATEVLQKLNGIL